MTFCSSNQRLVVWVSPFSLKVKFQICLKPWDGKTKLPWNLKCHQHYFQGRLLWRAFGNLKLVSGYLRVERNASVYRIYSNTNVYFPSHLITSKISYHCSSFNSGISRMHAVWSLQWFTFITGIIVVWEPECGKVISILYQEVL